MVTIRSCFIKDVRRLLGGNRGKGGREGVRRRIVGALKLLEGTV